MFMRELDQIVSEDILAGTTHYVKVNDKVYYCDYANPSTMKVVEVFGTFWHMSPRKYQADDLNKLTKQTGRQTWENDGKKLSDLASIGYDVLVIWEEDIYADLHKELQKAKNFLESKNEDSLY